MVKRKTPEADLQAAIVQLLRVYERQGFLRFFHVPNQLPRPSMLVRLIGLKKVNMIYALIEKSLRRIGKRPGFPDLGVLIMGGTAVFLEVKADNGTIQPNQREWHSWLNLYGFDTHVVSSLEEVLIILRPLLPQRKAA